MCFDTILVKQGAQNPVGIRKYPAKLASAGYRVVEGGEGEVGTDTSRSSGADSKGSRMAEGTVMWFNASKCYGFIEYEDGPDVFVYYSAIQDSGYRTLEDGQNVEFKIVDGPKGLQAQNVRPL